MRHFVAASYLAILAVLAGFVLFGQPARSPDPAGGASRFRIDRAMDDLRAIDSLSARAGGRAVGSPGNALTRDYISRRFEEAGLRVSEQKFRDILGGPMTNIVAVLPGELDETVLVSAHHDVDGPGPGAVEGTAGLATLLELARSAAEARAAGSLPGRSRTLVFASWDGDALACAGSTHFIDALSARDRGRLRAVVSLDSIGWKGGTPALHVMPYQDRFGRESIAPDWLVMRVEGAARARGGSLPVGDRWLGLVYQVLVRSVDVGYYSDDRPFLAKGVPAVFIGNFSLTNAYDRSGTGSDTIDQVGAEQLGSVGISVEGALSDLAVAERLPVGEQEYLVFQSLLGRPFRLTRDQVNVLAALALLPGGIALLRRRRDGGLVLTRALFLAFATIFALAMLADPILFSALFVPSLLAAPLLAIPRGGAVWAHLVSFVPALVYGALLIPVVLTGSAGILRASPLEFAALAGLLLIGLIQLPLHARRIRTAALSPA